MCIRDRCAQHPETVTDADRSTLVKNLKNVASRTEAVTSMVVKWMQDQQIPFIGAPWEGEWQLVQMERDGRIDGIIANDGDCFILGSRRIIFDIDFGKRQFRELNVMEATAKYNENNNHYRIFKYKQENLAIISCFFGNDYIKRINRIGKKKIWKILDLLPNDKIWTITEMRQAIEKFDERFSQSDEFWKKFEECCCLIKHCPVLDSWNNVVPLLPIPSGMEWNAMIGFDPISSLPVDRQSFKHASLFSTCNFLSGNRPLHIFNPRLYSTEDNPDCVGEELPPFAASKRPIVSMPNFVLESYIISRLGSIPNNETREELEKLAANLQNASSIILPPSRIPNEYDKWVIGEMLEPYDLEEDFTNNGWYEVLNDFSKVPKLVDHHLKSDFVGNENIFKRVCNLFNGGNVRLETLNLSLIHISEPTRPY